MLKQFVGKFFIYGIELKNCNWLNLLVEWCCLKRDYEFSLFRTVLTSTIQILVQWLRNQEMNNNNNYIYRHCNISDKTQ